MTREHVGNLPKGSAIRAQAVEQLKREEAFSKGLSRAVSLNEELGYKKLFEKTCTGGEGLKYTTVYMANGVDPDVIAIVQTTISDVLAAPVTSMIDVSIEDFLATVEKVKGGAKE